MKRIIGLIVGLLLFAPIAMAQSYGRDQNCQLQTALGQAVAGAQVYFLTQPANVGALTPQAQVYSSATGGTVTQPVLTNGFGECTAYLAPGVYTVVYVSPFTGTLSYPDQNIAIGGGSPSSPAFGAITSGVNTAAAMQVGSGASLTPTGSGIIAATKIDGVAVTGTPGTGQVITATSPTAANWQTPTSGGGACTGSATTDINCVTTQTFNALADTGINLFTASSPTTSVGNVNIAAGGGLSPSSQATVTVTADHEITVETGHGDIDLEAGVDIGNTTSALSLQSTASMLMESSNGPHVIVQNDFGDVIVDGATDALLEADAGYVDVGTLGADLHMTAVGAVAITTDTPADYTINGSEGCTFATGCGGGGGSSVGTQGQMQQVGSTSGSFAANSVSTPGVGIFEAPTNFSNGNSGATPGSSVGCQQTLLPGDTGATAFGSTCIQDTFNDYYPGAQYGYPGQFQSQDGYGAQTFFSTINSFANGTRAWINSNHLFTGAGDINELDLQLHVKPAWITGSDQGVSQNQYALYENDAYTGTVTGVATGSNDSAELTLTATANVKYGIGPSSPLLKTNTVQSGTLTYVTTLGSGIIEATYNHTVAASVGASFHDDFSIPRVTANTTGQLSATLSTFTLNVSTPLNVGDYCDVYGNVFQETFKIRTAPSPVAGVQTITAYMRYSHNAASPVLCGGMVGHYVEYSDQTDSGRVYVQNVFGSLAGNILIIGYQIPNAFAGYFPDGTANVNVYEGAEVVGVADPANNFIPDSAYLAVMPTPTSWISAAVMNTNNIAAAYANYFTNSAVNNPYAQRFNHNEYMQGYGGGLSGDVGWVQWSPPASGSYVGTSGGQYIAPYLLSIQGLASTGISFRYAPLGGGTGGIRSECGSYLICVGQLAPSATSTRVNIFTFGAHDDHFWYETSDDTWHLDASQVMAGNQTFGGYDGATHTVSSVFTNLQCQGGGGCPTNGGGALFAAPTTTADLNGEVLLESHGTTSNLPTLAFRNYSSHALLSSIGMDVAGHVSINSAARGDKLGTLDLANLNITGTCTGCPGGASIAHTFNVLAGDNVGNGVATGISYVNSSTTHGLAFPASSTPSTTVGTFGTDASGNPITVDPSTGAGRVCNTTNNQCIASNGGTITGHLGFTAATAPTVSSCGGGTVTSSSTDNSLQITGIAATTTSCTVTFHAPVQQGFCTANFIDSDQVVSYGGQNSSSTTSASIFVFQPSASFTMSITAHCF